MSRHALIGAVFACVLSGASGAVLGHGCAPKPPDLAPCVSLDSKEDGRALVVTCEGDRGVRQLGDAVTVWCECP